LFIGATLSGLAPNEELSSSANVQVAPVPAFARGRQFVAEAERSLYPFALEAAHGLPGATEGVLLLPEMVGPIGVPDFVALIGGRAELEARLESGIPPVTSRIDIAILSAVSSRRPTRLAALESALGMPSKYLASRVRQLVSIGTLHTLPTGSVQRERMIEPAGSVVAIETKLRDWRRAVHQARRYRTWAENYVVVLGSVASGGLEGARQMVSEDRGGLYFEGQWLCRPRRRPTSWAARFNASEAIVAAMKNYQPSSS
jgi:hypothetical protein